MKYYLGIDIGGTNIAVGILDESNQIIVKENASTPTPCSEEVFCDVIAQTVRAALAKANITTADLPFIGVGCPGTVNRETGMIEYANNLGFANFPLQKMLEDRLDGKQVIMENDANAAAYGEYKCGALKGTRNALAITLGTGIGGGVIIEGKIYAGSNFAGGELGHSVIVKDGYPCTCGRRGCWESYASATGLIRMTKDAMEADKSSKMWEVSAQQGKVSGRTAFDAMRAGDASAKKVVDDYIGYLSCGLTNMVNIFQPDILCIGGGICNEGETLLSPVRAYIDREQYARNNAKKTVICRAELGNDAGIIGAALLGE